MVLPSSTYGAGSTIGWPSSSATSWVFARTSFVRLRHSGSSESISLRASSSKSTRWFTDRENVLAHVEFNKELRLPTGADLSPDGRKLAVLTADALWVFDKPAKGDKWLSSSARRVMLPLQKTKQAEAVCWEDDKTLRVTNEQRELFLVRLSSLEKVE